ncbi:dienelactone hydrolase family protein [Rhizobium sp. RU36D]|uniref:alpha/beta hydrolase family protein n=1 Tax=Rhizobium sp. RU36D TaxID=1907415 RepID=UPI0009D7B5C5|nr:dienelactone hydrolase family protein [Rhizobium sp. RU36D]SMC99931.1 Dienelactone hydrolase [Rhizobium sp. RU36D]
MTISVDRLRDLYRMREVTLTLTGRETEDRGDYLLERLRFVLGDGTPVRGFLTRPKGATSPGPAILYAHAHGGRYDIGAAELVEGRPALLDAPGPAFARAGYVTLCIDMPTFGERSTVTESAAAKAALWKGETLFGRMLAENAAALTWLAALPQVDPGRIGMTGISMGATLTYFLAAIDERIKASAHLCCYADFATLIDTAAHDLHGHYLTIPGLLAETSTGEIAGLVAPRPQLICLGLDDPLTPPLAIERAKAETVAAYARAGAGEALSFLEQDGVGHSETAEMREAVLGFFGRWL